MSSTQEVSEQTGRPRRRESEERRWNDHTPVDKDEYVKGMIVNFPDVVLCEEKDPNAVSTQFGWLCFKTRYGIVIDNTTELEVLKLGTAGGSGPSSKPIEVRVDCFGLKKAEDAEYYCWDERKGKEVAYVPEKGVYDIEANCPYQPKTGAFGNVLDAIHLPHDSRIQVCGAIEEDVLNAILKKRNRRLLQKQSRSTPKDMWIEELEARLDKDKHAQQDADDKARPEQMKQDQQTKVYKNEVFMESLGAELLTDLVATTLATALRTMLHDNHAKATHALVDGPLGAMVTSLRTRREPMDVQSRPQATMIEAPRPGVGATVVLMIDMAQGSRGANMSFAANSTTGDYQYQPLDHATQQIRLVTLQDPLENDDAIRLDIEVFEISEAPPYTALSYVWGPPSNNAVYIATGRLEIRDNLFKFLTEFRKYHDKTPSDRYMWIDQLCIHQSSTVERNHQVQMMSDIYSKATSVIAWLGDGSERADPSTRIATRECDKFENTRETFIFNSTKYVVMADWDAFVVMLVRSPQ
ncbi:uncharacterized protein J4E92_009247 [Alternaria infectoria]|uniref:uncharacterized protein n=1 Tax=Alternaria infectoria TaxID=45303 RepID=UPI00221F03CE|nr:uncharacterized protein J4E92_009247 [Alternaria infectoria]KAI4916330.1 hypothetical protein J4E92_009247 [Alternaria infectoria]